MHPLLACLSFFHRVFGALVIFSFQSLPHFRFSLAVFNVVGALLSLPLFNRLDGATTEARTCAGAVQVQPISPSAVDVARWTVRQASALCACELHSHLHPLTRSAFLALICFDEYKVVRFVTEVNGYFLQSSDFRTWICRLAKLHRQAYCALEMKRPCILWRGSRRDWLEFLDGNETSEDSCIALASLFQSHQKILLSECGYLGCVANDGACLVKTASAGVESPTVLLGILRTCSREAAVVGSTCARLKGQIVGKILYLPCQLILAWG